MAENRVLTTWGEAAVWRQFGDDAKTTFSTLQDTNQVTMTTDLGGAWAQFRLGLSGQVTPNINLFANGDYNVGLNDASDHSLGGSLGIGFQW